MYTRSQGVAERVPCSRTALTVQPLVFAGIAGWPQPEALLCSVPFRVPQVTAGGYALSFPLQPPQQGQQQEGQQQQQQSLPAGSAPDIAVGTDDTKLNLWSTSYRYGTRHCVRQQLHGHPAPRPRMSCACHRSHCPRAAKVSSVCVLCNSALSWLVTTHT